MGSHFVSPEKVQFSECPRTKCETARLKPAVLLWSLNRDVRVLFA
jgi:hypothetical protein